jgi:hypothetical protein
MRSTKWRKVLSAARSRVSGAVHAFMAAEYLPAERRDDDLFVVEFPKSGVTWVTFLLANVHKLMSGDRRNVTWFNINDFVPDVQVVRHVPQPILPVPGYRCFKSHSPYIWHYRKVIYLVRDPRNVMVSYWTFLQSLGAWQGTLPQFVRDPEHGIETWVRHVGGWLERVDAAASFTLVKYEDLLANPVAELGRLYDLLGIAAGEDLLAQAVELSSIERMRRLEAVFSARHPALQNLEFVRRGQAGGSRVPLPEEVRLHIEARAAGLMRRLGYLPAASS